MKRKPWGEKETTFLIEMLKGRNVDDDFVEEYSKTYPRSRDSILNRRQQLIRQGIIKKLVDQADEPPVVAVVPSVNRELPDLFAAKAAEYLRKRERGEAKKSGVDIYVPDGGPYGLLFVGDPHVGDSGSNLELLSHHIALVNKTKRCYAVNMGDLTNNWVGTLKGLYAYQQSTEDEDDTLMKWLLEATNWLFVILGNHDKWTRIAETMCRENNVPYVSHGSKFNLHCDGTVMKLDARHTHRGNSQYNPSFAQAKQSYRGSDCDVIIGAHTHVSAYTMLRNGVTGHLSHCIRVGSYKDFDEYADSNNFSEDCIGPAVLVIVDPSKDGEVGFVKVFWDVEDGVSYLDSLTLRVAS